VQEEVENRTVNLVIRTAKLTGDALKFAVSKYLADRKEKSGGEPVSTPERKQTVARLAGREAGTPDGKERNVNDPFGFERFARKYGIEYTVRKDSSSEEPDHLVFFRARDRETLTAAFNEYTDRTEQKDTVPSASVFQKDIGQHLQTRDIFRERKKEKGLEL